SQPSVGPPLRAGSRLQQSGPRRRVVAAGQNTAMNEAAMFTLSAFADEISPDPQEQIDVLTRCGVKHIELRSILKTNVLDLTDLQIAAFKTLLDRHEIRISAIGSPIGKIKIDQPFEPHFKRFERAL